MLECEERERRTGEYNPYGKLTYGEWSDVQRVANSARSPIVVTPGGFAFVTQAERGLISAPTLLELLVASSSAHSRFCRSYLPASAASSSSMGADARSVILPVFAPGLAGYEPSTEDFEDDYTDDAEVVKVEKEAVEKVVWTRLANGQMLRTRYDLPDSGLEESDIDAQIVAYYAAPLRYINGVWYPVRNGIAYRC